MGMTPTKFYSTPPYHHYGDRAARERQWEEMLTPYPPLGFVERHPHLTTLFLGGPFVVVMFGIFYVAFGR